MSVTANFRPFPLAMHHFYLPGQSLPVSALFRWPYSISIHLPGLSLLVSALVRWPCSISVHVSPRPVTGGAAGHVAFLLSPRSVTAGVRPFLLAM